MRITVSAKPKKKNPYVEQLTPTFYVVAVKEPAENGRANAAIIKALSDYFSIPQADIKMISGNTSKQKIFDVPDSLVNFESLPKQKPLF